MIDPVAQGGDSPYVQGFRDAWANDAGTLGNYTSLTYGLEFLDRMVKAAKIKHYQC